MFFAMRHEIAENRARKGAKFPLVPEWQRTPCLKCGGVAKKDGISRKCVECNFGWYVENGNMTYPTKDIAEPKWNVLEEGLLLVLWEKQL